MAEFDLITKEDLQKFKMELFAELKRPSYKLNKKDEKKEWLKSYEVRNILNISGGYPKSGHFFLSKVATYYAPKWPSNFALK